MSLPLSNQTILVTRAAKQSKTFRHLLEKQGATVIEMAALEIRPPSTWEHLDQALRQLSSFDWLILTSANGVKFFFERLKQLSIDRRLLDSLKMAVVGQKTAAVLEKEGIKPTFIPPNFVADSLVAKFPENLSKQKILFPRVESGGREVLIQEFQAQNAEVIAVAAYQSGCPKTVDPIAIEALKTQTVDIITFASSKTVQCFYNLLISELGSRVRLREVLAEVYIASIGPQTSQSCQELLNQCDIEAKVYTLEGLTEAITERISGGKRQEFQ
ncbi:uroporphyrinogen-III synthase [Dactylococcopsis salina]|uniref:Uroporphyrinogen-III synthase n=1 Tax=Dactylococcopsis salina (strain PCC 8305) TaxID=13035 RepID=K9YXH2_DACS8|nr:uroporphyrinogen-III synthase [Dactylococcopsis salina]AFZ51631.1 uroporphyrinogen-III synthase [Dactylococcopsis salina PCC 8305]